MLEFLKYDMKVAVLMAIFYLVYRLLLSRETFHHLNRLVLLAIAVASFVLPCCVITFHDTVVLAPIEASNAVEQPLSVIIEPSQPCWQIAISIVFLLGVLAVFVHIVWAVVQVIRLIMHSEHHPQDDGVVIAVTDKSLEPFSWMRYIVLSLTDFEHQDPAIMAHERGHIRQRHSLDVLLVDILTVLQWFNPAIWMLRRDLRAIHEYEADAAVLSQGINMRQYQYLLIQKTVAHGGYSIANGISNSTLKNRINMMLRNKKSNSKSWLKLLAFLPIVGTVMALNAETVTDYVYQQPQKKIVKKGRKTGKMVVSGKTIEVNRDTVTPTPTSIQVINENKELLKDPLVIIDGEHASTDDMRTLDPKNIDHVDVLKDNAAIEIYGEEGKNGVINITTKNAVSSGQSQAKDQASEEEGEDESIFTDVFDVVEQMPEFPGGTNAMMKFLAENVHYPEAAYKNGAQGRVLVSFIIEPNGSISNVHVVKKANDDLDAEAVRVIGSMPKWTPGMQNGKVVRVRYTLPVTFCLN
jgi:TonB family protein